MQINFLEQFLHKIHVGRLRICVITQVARKNDSKKWIAFILRIQQRLWLPQYCISAAAFPYKICLLMFPLPDFSFLTYIFETHCMYAPKRGKIIIRLRVAKHSLEQTALILNLMSPGHVRICFKLRHIPANKETGG